MTRSGKKLVFVAGLALALCGCSDEPDAPGDAGGVDGGPRVDSGGDVDAGDEDIDAGPVGDVTYYGDVRPLLAEHCLGCHTDGGIGPFPLDTYDAAAPLATRLMEVTRDRIMPPWLADNSGDCHTWRDARWLNDRELRVLAAWDEQGEPMGDPATPAPVVPALPTLSGTISTIETPTYVPDASANDDYRCFVVDAVSAEDTFLTGYEVHPGNTASVHHVIVYAPTDETEAAEARARDTGDGYTCFGAAGVNAFPVVLWAPGGGATNFPDGTGVRLEAGLPLIIQVHYNLLASEEADHTRIDLQTSDTATNAYILPLGDYDLRLSPRMPSVSTTHVEDLGAVAGGLNVPLTIYGEFPHMHTLGRQLRVDHIPASGEAEQCLVDVPRWDFNWQLAYFYETPVTISSLDSLRITCTYDTTDRTADVTWGEGTQDEMCLNFFYVVIAGGIEL